jgi:hypothetical protein
MADVIKAKGGVISREEAAKKGLAVSGDDIVVSDDNLVVSSDPSPTVGLEGHEVKPEELAKPVPAKEPAKSKAKK